MKPNELEHDTAIYPAYLEAVFKGLNVLSSATASVRMDDGNTTARRLTHADVSHATAVPRR